MFVAIKDKYSGDKLHAQQEANACFDCASNSQKITKVSSGFILINLTNQIPKSWSSEFHLTEFQVAIKEKYGAYVATLYNWENFLNLHVRTLSCPQHLNV